ncbi:gluconokinase [Melissococcus sp. OM08-11BH]|uniref:gluconokinase n=1 Tax=Melissococcus sp. OM08-11BH TaxID=2293110 RepID=UPI000E496C62|nr:gluconokinase [Melissococcus sp. OM08-11BH]RGI32296.1 gluconokinase [Melissococcus sp. OM08-11BH]
MYPLAIDVGTTNIKLQIFEKDTIIEELVLPIETFTDRGSRVFQSPAHIYRQIVRGIRTMTQEGYNIDSIVLTTAMHSIMPIVEGRDEEMYIWLDAQSKPFVETIKSEKNYLNYYKKTGTPIHEMSPFAKIGYFQKEKWFNDVIRWVGMKDYLMERLTGEFVVDYSIASATGLFNIHDKKWDDTILKKVGTDESMLAKLVDTDYSAPLLEDVADELFLTPNIPVYIGASDGCLASYASYVANGTLNTITIGTSGAVRKLSKTIELDDKGQTFCYYLNDTYWVIGGATNNGGQIMTWAENVFFEGQSIYQELNHSLSQSPIGSDELLFFPYLTGERAPIWQSTPQGKYIGLSLQHTKHHMVRSIVEGIFYNLRYISELIELEPREITVNGGFFANELLAMMAADIFGQNVVQSVYNEPNFGAVSLIHPVKSFLLSDHRRTFYTEDNHHLYNHSYESFKKELETNIINK